jgi:hypothetical protein
MLFEKPLKNRNHLRILRIGERILEKHDLRVWTGYSWFRYNGDGLPGSVDGM